MRYLLISVLILVLISSCSLPITKGLVEHSSKKEYIVNDYFSNIERDYVYKAKFKFLKHQFGGILIIKKISENHHRVVFTTEFGNKLFDLEFEDGDFSVNFILDKLKKNFILKMLQHDFQTLLGQNIKVSKQYSNMEEDIFLSEREEFQNYYVFYKGTGQLIKIVSASKNREKLIITFLVTKKDISTSIILNHKKFNAKMDLKYIGIND